jgi:hypothetical protein
MESKRRGKPRARAALQAVSHCPPRALRAASQRAVRQVNAAYVNAPCASGGGGAGNGEGWPQRLDHCRNRSTKKGSKTRPSAQSSKHMS